MGNLKGLYFLFRDDAASPRSPFWGLLIAPSAFPMHRIYTVAIEERLELMRGSVHSLHYITKLSES